MAITDIEAFAHLTEADIDALATELDAIRADVEESLGERDARYIHRTIAAQRALEVAGRVLLAFGSKRSAWWAGTATLAIAKIIENMEISHNVLHGQWDWMNDPEIHSSTWEWDMVGASKHWRITHNVAHHKYTNILGMDDDVGYGLLRVTRDDPWTPRNMFNVFFNTVLAVGFQWGIGLQHFELRKIYRAETRAATVVRLRELSTKAARQLARLPGLPAVTALSPRNFGKAGFTTTLKANLAANVIRNLWANAVIFCVISPTAPRSSPPPTWWGEQGPVVSAADARQRQHRRRSGDGLRDRQPVPSDRASPLPGPAQPAAGRDLGAGARAVRQVRPAYTSGRCSCSTPRPAHHRQTVAARPVPARHRRRRTRDPQRADVRGLARTARAD